MMPQWITLSRTIGRLAAAFFLGFLLAYLALTILEVTSDFVLKASLGTDPDLATRVIFNIFSKITSTFSANIVGLSAVAGFFSVIRYFSADSRESFISGFVRITRLRGKRKAKSELHNSFAGLVARRVMLKKQMAAVTFGILTMVALSEGVPTLYCSLLGVSCAWYVIDLITISYRLDTGEFGDIEAEVLEAARYVSHRVTGGGGTGGFKHIFEPGATAQVAALDLGGEPTGAAHS
jgi:hypothetical protein